MLAGIHDSYHLFFFFLNTGVEKMVKGHLSKDEGHRISFHLGDTDASQASKSIAPDINIRNKSPALPSPGSASSASLP